MNGSIGRSCVLSVPSPDHVGKWRVHPVSVHGESSVDSKRVIFEILIIHQVFSRKYLHDNLPHPVYEGNKT